MQEQIGDFLEEMLGFSDGLVSNTNGQLLLDPDNVLDLDSTDEEGTNHFLSQALKSKPVQNIPRTRSQTKADLAAKQVVDTPNKIVPAQKLKLRHGVSVDTIVDSITKTPRPGDLVFAHKGKNVQFWFPGVVQDKAKKVFFKIDFLADFGQEICPLSNIMPFEDYAERKKNDKNSKLFSVPRKFLLNFENALVAAESYKDDN